MNSAISLGFFIITKNEEEKIRNCLESIKDIADEIVIVDSGSTDNTINICKNYTNRVYIHDNWSGFGKQFQIAQDYLSTDWVFSIDADEVVSEDLANSIKNAVANNQDYIYEVQRNSYIYKKLVKYCWGNDLVPRLFKKDAARHSNDMIHPRIINHKNLKIKRLKGSLKHYTFECVKLTAKKYNMYAEQWAMQNKGRKSSLTKAILHAFWCFIKMFIIKKGFLDGKNGFIISTLNSYCTFLKYLYLYFDGKSAKVKDV